jgi:hypothetical protein
VTFLCFSISPCLFLFSSLALGIRRSSSLCSFNRILQFDLFICVFSLFYFLLSNHISVQLSLFFLPLLLPPSS